MALIMFNNFKQVVRILYIIALMCFTVWYGYFLYPVIFDIEDDTKDDNLDDVELDAYFGSGTTEEEKEFLKSLKQQQSVETTDLGYMIVKEQYVKGHFHHIGMMVETDNYSVCIRCHGAVPHDRAKSIRAFLNMHAFYLACETCHVRPEQTENAWTFRWYDKSTGSTIENPPGLNTSDESMYGNYSAKVAPGEISENGSFSFINGPDELAFVERYLQDENFLNDTQKSKMKMFIHRKVNEDPLLCDKCHTADSAPYLPFLELGYPRRRLFDLTSTEVIGIIKKYQHFYIPNILHGGETDSSNNITPSSNTMTEQ